ncbi:unnamed protein product, partial [Meganyctiphanes norvegica]
MPPYNIQKRDSLKLQSIPGDMDGDSLRGNLSHQALVAHEGGVNVQVVPAGGHDEQPRGCASVTKTQIITMVVLCYVNLINYMDRMTVAGILTDIQKSYKINDSKAGLLQTGFVLTYMVMAPLFGYLGDRFSRKYLMAVGVFFWSLTTLIGSYMPSYELFLMCRCFVGIGEASYSTIAPTIISDMFVKDIRSTFLAVFYILIPVGSGLGYIIGAEVTNLAKIGLSEEAAAEAWRWGLRVTPVMGLIAVILILFVMVDPPRGESEGGEHLQATSFWSDLVYLATNKSYVWSTLAFTMVTFVAGALAFWGPLFVESGVKIQAIPTASANSVAFVFGAVAMTAGLVGVPLGSFTGQKLRKRWDFADPAVCGVGLLLSFPFISAAMYLSEFNTKAAYAVVFFGQVFLNLNWSIVSDIVLYIIIPTRRSSAEAFQILFSHAFGDAISPYLVGVVSDAFNPLIVVPDHNSTLTTTTVSQYITLPSTMVPDLSLNSTVIPTDAPDDWAQDYIKFKVPKFGLITCCVVQVLGVYLHSRSSCLPRR